MYTVLCAYEDRQIALRAITKMIRAGLPRDDIHVQPETDFYVDVEDEQTESERQLGLLGRIGQSLTRIAQPKTPPGAEGTYRDAVRKGSTVVVVHVSQAEEAMEAATLMSELGAFDVEHRRTR